MRRAFVVGFAALAAALALATALADTSHRAPAAQGFAGSEVGSTDAPGAPPGDVDDGIESMDGPDAWDAMGMGPAGPQIPDSPWGPGGAGVRRMAAHRQELARELDLTADQRDKIDAIRDKQRRVAIEQRAKLDIARLDLRSLLRAEKLDRSAVNTKIDEIARMQATLRKGQIGSMLDMRAVLTPEQQQKLRSLRSP